MEHLSPAGNARDAAGSMNNAGNEALSPLQDNNSVHQHADINLQAGLAAADESPTSRFTASLLRDGYGKAYIACVAACSHARALRTLPRPTRTSIGTPLQD